MSTHAEAFGTRPFVAGSLTGIRAYRVREDGALTGIHIRQVAEPGENYAVCAMPYRPLNDDQHRLVALGCVCGFYAYFDGSDDYLHNGWDGAPRIEAIVEAYGSVVVGSRGFRAEKLRLVALVRTEEPEREPLRWRDLAAVYLAKRVWLAASLVSAGFIGGIGMAAMTATRSAWWFLPEIASLAVSVVVHRLYRRGWRRMAAERVARLFGCHVAPTAADWHRIKARYPRVPVYTSREAALAAHPLTVPEAP